MVNKLKKLQDKFAEIDLLIKKGHDELFEILLKKLLPLEFRMEPDHHGAPNIHINYGKEKHIASYGINDGKRVAGNLSSKYDKVARDWIASNQTTLQEIYTEMQVGNQNKMKLK